MNALSSDEQERKMGVPLHVLIVEDSKNDYLLLMEELRNGGYDPVCERVETGEAMTAALDREAWDVVLIDYTLPHFSGIAALELIKRKHIDLPAIIVSGTIDDVTAGAAMKAGAHDYITKNNLARFIPAIEREMHEAKGRQERRRIRKALEETEKKFFAIFQHSPVSMAITSIEEGRLFDVNEQYTRLMGFSQEELIGHTTTELNLWVDPEERKKYIQSTKKNRGEIQNYPVSVRTKSGNVIKVLFSAAIIKINDASYLLSSAVDITERVKTEDILKTQAHILDRMAEGVNMADENGFITFTNPTFDAIFGYERGELIGQHVSVLNTGSSADSNRLSNEIIQTLKTSGVWSGEVANRKKDGTPFTTHAHVSAMEISGKTFWVSVQEDITERKKTDEALRAAEGNFRHSLDDSPLGVRIATAEGETLYVNRAILDIFGYDSIEELRTIPLKELYTPESHADAQIRKEKRNQGDTVPSEYEVSIVKKNGEVRRLQVFRKQTLWGGEQQFQVIYQDITRRKQAEAALLESEEKYRDLFDFLPIPVYEMDWEANITSANRAIYETFRGTEEDFKNGLTVWQLVSPEDIDRSIKNIQRLLKGEQIGGTEYTLMRLDGSVFPAIVTSSVIYSDGKPVGLRGAIIDITQHKWAEEKIRASREQLRALAGRLQSAREEERMHIAREIHDELGGAMTAMKIDTSLLAKTIAKVRDKALRESQKARTDEMTKLIDATTRTVRRIATGLRPGILDDLGLRAAMEWQVTEFQKRTGIRCEFSSSDKFVELDEFRATTLFRIAQEALTNVARHARATEVHIRLQATTGAVLLEIKDNGVGIKEEEIQSLKALGILGMRERTLSCEGRFTITGRPGEGTTVRVESPPVEKRKQDREADG